MKVSNKQNKTDIKIIIENEQKKITVDEIHLKLLEDTIICCIEDEDFNKGCEIGITLVDNERIKEINREFRQIDTPTDVLSFPIVEMKEGLIISEEGDYNMDENLLLLGDIVISLEKCEKQAIEYGHPFQRELAFLTTHGLLHLLGYNHEDEEKEAKMLSRQEQILAKMGFKRV